MFHADLHQTRLVEGPSGVTLICSRSSLRAATPFGGGGYAYSHPVAVRHDPTGAVVPIRDHVMAFRLGLLVVVLLATIGRLIHVR